MKKWTVEWIEAVYGKQDRRTYKVKCTEEEMNYILQNLLVKITGVRITYRIYRPNGTLYKRGKI